MKAVEIVTALFVSMTVATSCPCLFGQEIQVGDDMETVTKVLGQPRSWIQIGTVKVCYYELGKVELKEGRVTRVELMTPEQAALARERLEAERTRREEIAAAKRNELREEGLALKERMLALPQFTNSPASFQVEFWKNFMARYPDVAVEAEYAQAQAKLAAEETQRRCSELEQRLSEAELRVRIAEQEARERSRQPEIVVQYSPPIQYVPWPVVWIYPYSTTRPCRDVGGSPEYHRPPPRVGQDEPTVSKRPAQTTEKSSREWLQYVPVPTRRDIPASWPYTPFPRIESIAPIKITPMP
ncbi:MAG: hypothetical protein ACUVWX_04965 [Kiritimatiellia bacterium]